VKVEKNIDWRLKLDALPSIILILILVGILSVSSTDFAVRAGSIQQ